MNQDQARRWAEEVDLPEPDGTAEANMQPHPEGGYTYDEVPAWSETIVREAIAAALVKLTQGQEAVALAWTDGEPPHPWNKEWFIAQTIYGDRVVLTALEQPHSYDYKTADGTYMLAKNVAKWMQFPDSDYKYFSTPPAQPAREWRPIDTAPKDGSLIVARGNNHGDEELGQHHCIASWFNGCWAEASDWNPTSELTFLTHWLPLPNAVAVREKNAGQPVVKEN